MPPQTNVYVTAPQTAKAKGFMGFFKPKAKLEQGWSTIRSLGHSPRRASRQPVFE
ncbi:hypothetical protein [Caulobacter segnis]|uniref:hypothetical protein n=1 Tax=Caulobacter segnis TaxID=88688 RepID=UPI0028678A8A|nr:hypothetical protein [Caulobacter segnis]MDR6624623.1 hypothetical protein [Caulobacter segnis]